MTFVVVAVFAAVVASAGTMTSFEVGKRCHCGSDLYCYYFEIETVVALLMLRKGIVVVAAVVAAGLASVFYSCNFCLVEQAW